MYRKFDGKAIKMFYLFEEEPHLRVEIRRVAWTREHSIAVDKFAIEV